MPNTTLEHSLTHETLNYMKGCVRYGKNPTLKELSLECKEILWNEMNSLSGENRKCLERISADLSNLIESSSLLTDCYIEGIVEMFTEYNGE